MSGGSWHVRSGRGRWGPLRDEDVRLGLDRGHFGSGALVWRRGLPCWQPLVVHFPPAPRRSDAWKLVAGLAGMAAVGGLSVYLHLTQMERFGSLRLGLAVWGLSLLVMLPLAAWLSWRGWRRARRLQPFQPVAAGVQRLGALAVLMLAAGLALIQAVTMPLLYPTLLLREGFRDYRIEVLDGDPGREIRMSGSIGPGFSQALELTVQRHPDAQRLVLSSSGGLVDEALLAARVLEASGLEAVARGTCDSACVMVLMGARRRLADWDLVLGFHAVSDLRDGDAGERLDPGAVDEMARRARAFLLSRGVPEALLERAEGYQRNEVLPVSAIELVEVGALQGLSDGGAGEIGLDEAKWRFLEGLYAARDPDDPMAALMALVRSSRPELMLRWADAIHRAWTQQSMGRAGELAGRFAGDVVVAALRAADDRAVAAYYGDTVSTLQQLGRQGDWQACQAAVEGRPRAGGASADATQVSRQLSAVVALAQSAARQDWEVRALPPGVERDGRALVAALAQRVSQEGGGDARARCEAYVSLYAHLLRKSEHEAAPLLRWLGTPDGPEW